MKKLFLALIFLALLGTGAILAPAATADGFALCYGDEGQSGCLPDNKDHTFCWSSSFGSYQNMIDDIRAGDADILPTSRPCTSLAHSRYVALARTLPKPVDIDSQHRSSWHVVSEWS